MQERPVYLDLTKIRLPMSAFSSITHRLSGMYVFFITLPVLLYAINKSTSTKESYEELILQLNTFSIFSFLFYISVSIFWYHILTGVRHLIMDFFHIGESLKGANFSSIFVVCFWAISFSIFLGYLFL
tara:strand:- start:2895 stop:3278 length:384 start_codon:yes stop_codon:yes gene_type:complete